MSSFALGPLSNREPQYQNQNTLIFDGNGRLRFAAISRRALALPPEILAAIFMHCLPDVRFTRPSLITAPLVFCVVCHQWREVALATPGLWSSLSFNVQLAARAGHDGLFRRWLSRARSTPLSLRLHDSHMYTESAAPALVKSLLQTVVELSPQWRNVHINLGVYLAKLLPLEGKFPLLEKLNIRLPEFDDLPISFCDAPKLRDVCIPLYRGTRLQLPWQQLTKFRTNHTGFTLCLEIFRDASNLIDGTFKLEDFGEDSPAPAITIPPLVHLRSLTLAGGQLFLTGIGIAPMAILDYLKAPALKNLTLKFPRCPDALDVSPFLSFTSRSSFQLHTLALSFIPKAESLIQCLEVLPSLVHLKIEPPDPRHMNTIFAHFTGNTDFLPKLESFHTVLLSSRLHYITQSVMIDFLCWRWAAVGITRLQSFQFEHVCETPAFDDDIKSHSEFRRLEQEGMSLYVGMNPHWVPSILSSVPV
ncbi:hypothetical protein C8R44DRAFT_766367 [Mycena epipterygia]|nr:hypothetical protein C8R44DRAFT_766367 [Mycena epipterygia]